MFIKNSFQGVVPAMSLQDKHRKLIVAITRELQGYVACLEKHRCVDCLHAQIKVDEKTLRGHVTTVVSTQVSCLFSDLAHNR